MRVFWRIALVACVAIVGGCPSDEKETGATLAQTRAVPRHDHEVDRRFQKESGQLLEVERFALTEENLTLDYRVTNTFPRDIWVCTSLDGFKPEGEAFFERRIIDQTLRISCRGNLEHNAFIVGEGHAIYRRLAPGQSRSGSILLDLPIRPISPVHFDFNDLFVPEKSVILNQVVLEIGYFSEDLAALMSESSERGWQLLNPGPAVLEMQRNDPNIALAPYRSSWWDGLVMEQSARVVIPDVRVSGMLGRGNGESKP